MIEPFGICRAALPVIFSIQQVIDLKDTFLYTLHAILPILLVILLGYGVRQAGPWSDDFYKQLNSLCFRVFLPIQLFCNVYAIQDLSHMNWRLIGYLFAAILVCALLGAAAAKLFVPRQDQKGCIVQVAFRSNQAILGLALTQSLGGDAAMGFAALATSVSVPLFNVLAVVVLLVYGSSPAHRPTPRALLGQIARNPLILGALSGLTAVLLRQLLPVVDGQPVFTIQAQLPSLFACLTNLSRVASPVMLFVLGTRLDLGAVRGCLPQLGLGVALRLVVSPLLVIGTALLLRQPLGLTAQELPTLITVSASPVAVSSAVMVQELGGDDQLAGQLVVWTSVLSLFSIFAIVYLLRAAGLL